MGYEAARQALNTMQVWIQQQAGTDIRFLDSGIFSKKADGTLIYQYIDASPASSVASPPMPETKTKNPAPKNNAKIKKWVAGFSVAGNVFAILAAPAAALAVTLTAFAIPAGILGAIAGVIGFTYASETIYSKLLYRRWGFPVLRLPPPAHPYLWAALAGLAAAAILGVGSTVVITAAACIATHRGRGELKPQPAPGSAGRRGG